MIEDLEDFKAYLKGNCREDYDKITSPDIKDDAVNAIKSRHEKKYKIWQIVSLEPWIIDFHGGKLPPELLSGQLTTVDFYWRTIELAHQNLIYHNEELIAIRMQYAENLPNMVYSINTNQALTIYESQLQAAGYNKENTEKAIKTRKDCLTFCAKAESIGISAKEIKPVLQKAETINTLEQFAAHSKQIEQAKTPEEKKQALEQAKAFIKLNAEFLYNNSDQLDEICAQIPQTNSDNKDKDTPPATKSYAQTSKTSTKPTAKADINPQKSVEIPTAKGVAETTAKNVEKPTAKSLKEQTAKSLKEPTEKGPSASYNIYTHLSECLDTHVDTHLKILDTALSLDKKAHPQNDTTRARPLAGRTKSFLSETTTVTPYYFHLLRTKRPLKPADVVPAPKHMEDWCDSYISNRCAQSREWGAAMRNSAEEIKTARLNAKSVDEFSAALMSSIEKRQQNIHQNLPHITLFSR